MLAADIISTVEFDHTGNYLATGDKGGRVVLFERNETVSPPSLNCCLSAQSNSCRFWPNLAVEENLRVQISHRVSVTRAGVRLPKVPRDRRENQQDQVVPSPKCFPLSPVYQ